jgi:hypothetical protein
MQDRCYNPKNNSYHRYGGRGIRVCNRWRDSIHDFYSDIGPRPSPQHSIDRYPNNDGNYEPGNVRWATSKQQARNTSKTRMIEVSGNSVPVCDIAEHLNCNAAKLFSFINEGGTIEDAIANPPQLDTHGGPRKGSGRPTTHGRRKGIGLSLTPDVLAFLDSKVEGKVLQNEDATSRSDVVDSIIRASREFKNWAKGQR